MPVVVLTLLVWVCGSGLAEADQGPSLDQYTEFIPAPGNDRPTKQLGQGPKGNLPKVDRGTKLELASLGEDGLAVRGVLERTAGRLPGSPGRGSDDGRGGTPAGGSDGRGGTPAGGSDGRGGTPAGGGPSGIEDVALGNTSGGLGFLLPIILLIALVVPVAMAARNRRGRAGSRPGMHDGGSTHGHGASGIDRAPRAWSPWWLDSVDAQDEFPRVSLFRT